MNKINKEKCQMDTRAFYDAICQTLNEDGMDITNSLYDRDGRYILNIRAVNPQTGQSYHIEMRKGEPNGTAVD